MTESKQKLNENEKNRISEIEEIKKSHQRKIFLWKTIGITSGVVFVGTLTYLIVTAVKDAVKD